MTHPIETAPGRSWAITVGLATALVFAGMFFAGGLWSPLPGLPLAAIFLVTAAGIYRRRSWSAYGGALLLMALMATFAVSLWRAPVSGLPISTFAVTVALFGLSALALFRAGRRMPAGSPGASRTAWIALAALVFAFPQFCRAYILNTGSMENTILAGDQILVVPLTGTPTRGELVQHRYPADRKQSFVKRVVAVGGDRVHLRDKQLFVNGAPVSEAYAVHRTDYVDPFRDNFPAVPNVALKGGWAEELRADTVNGELVVPAGKYFVLGDNRDNSLDSRYFGFLERSDITGKPVMVYFSAATPEEPAPDIGSRPPVLLHPSRIRWSRMFKGL